MTEHESHLNGRKSHKFLYPDHIENKELEKMIRGTDSSFKVSRCYPLTKGLVCAVVVGVLRLWNRRMHFGFPEAEFTEDKKFLYLAIWIEKVMAIICQEKGVFAFHDEELLKEFIRVGKEINFRGSKSTRQARISFWSEGFNFELPLSKEAYPESETTKHIETQMWSERENQWHEKQEKAFLNLNFSFNQEEWKNQRKLACSGCGRMVHLFCPMCLTWALDEPKKFAQVDLRLPVEVCIIAKEKEWRNLKCTAVQACMIAPKDTRWIKFPEQLDVLDEFDPETTFVLYPSETSLSVDDPKAFSWVNSMKRVVVLDSTCSGAKKMIHSEKLKQFRCLKIRTLHTTFWKYSRHGPEFLATIEAIYYFLKQTMKIMRKEESEVQSLDDLMSLYIVQLERVIENTKEKATKPMAWQHQLYVDGGN